MPKTLSQQATQAGTGLTKTGNTLALTTPVAVLNGGTGNSTGTATINANLTGPITSVGNATSIASQTGTGTKFVVDTAPTIVGGLHTAITSLGIRDTSAAFDVTIAAVSGTALTAGRTLTLDMGNVDHTVQFGTTANTITFPNAASGTVPFLNLAQTWTAQQTETINQNAATKLFLTNNSAGTAAWLAFEANNGTNVAQFGFFGVNKTAYGAIGSNTAFVYSDTNFAIVSDGGSLKFSAAGGAATQMTLNNTGNFGIGTTSPSRLLHVAGRFQMGGTAVATTDWALTSGWGANASISAVTGTDTRGTVTVQTSALDTPLGNPVITLTFKDGTWTTVPFGVANLNRLGTGLTGAVESNCTATTLVLEFIGTPTALTAATYIFNYIVVG